MSRNSKISVTVITGFLGAGKTTFINQLLKQNPETQFALVENEFGEISIDTKLIKGVDASRMFELKQGCICCTITDEYELVLAELAERFPHVEHLLIETTGIADPVPVISPFFRDESLKQIYQFKGTVCLVDGIHFIALNDKEIALRQIAVADSVVVSKLENQPSSEKQKLKEAIVRINPLCEISFSEFGVVKDFNLKNEIYKPKYFPETVADDSLHSDIFSKAITFTQPLNKDDFLYRLSYYLDVYKTKIYRVKGIICFENEPFEQILQGVGGSFELTEGNLIVSPVDSKIVFIGKLEDVDLDF